MVEPLRRRRLVRTQVDPQGKDPVRERDLGVRQHGVVHVVELGLLDEPPPLGAFDGRDSTAFDRASPGPKAIGHSQRIELLGHVLNSNLAFGLTEPGTLTPSLAVSHPACRRRVFVKKGRHRRFEEARSLKRSVATAQKRCPECGASPDDGHASWCLAESEQLDEILGTVPEGPRPIDEDDPLAAD